MAVIFKASFTTAQETKLAGIEAGAEVNVNADWNAVSGDAQILNKPTLGTAAATNSTDYATAAQGAKADTAVQPAAIGLTVLAFDSNLQSFVNAFTLPTTGGTAGQSLVTNGAGVLSFASESDPIFAASPAAAITAPQISNWNTAYGWGNHSSAGYLLSATAATTYQPLDGDLTSIGSLAGTTGLLRKTAANTWSLDTTTYLTGNQSITVSGDASGTGTTAIALTLANSGVTASTYRSVTVDAKGRVTAGTNPTTLSGYGITDAQPLDADLSSIAGLTETTGLLRKTAANTWSLDFDPVYIGGFAYFNRSTKPTERSAGVPLVVGDHWYNTSDGTEGFWNGTYWLSLTEFLLSIPEIVGQTADQVIPGSSAATTGSIFVDKLVHQTAVLNSTNTATNYWTLAVQVSGVSATTISTQNATNYPHQQVSLGLVIPARSAIPTGGSVVFTGLGQTSRGWVAMTTLGTDVYASVYGGDIYKQTNGTGNFLPLGQTSSWYGMTTLGTDVYACVYNGDIYKQTNGTGNFLPLGQTSRNWIGMTTLGTDVYACVDGGDIYKQTNGTGNFLPLGQTSRNWYAMTTLGTDVYACVLGGDIYKQTNGTGNFLPLGQTSRNWLAMTTLGTDVYASVYGGDIYKQTNGTGNFLPLGQTSRNWYGMTTLGTDVYACVYGGDIYKTSWFIDTVGHSARVTTTRVGTQTTSLYSAMSLTYRKVL